MRIFLAFLFLILATAPARAVEPAEMLSDPVLEERARELSKGLRCLVCQNQSIDDSNAELARDLRLLVRERIAAGDSNDQVVGYVVSRYGDFVLLSPPFKATTLVLWIGPLVIAFIAIGSLIGYFRRTTAEAPAPPLSEEERQRLQSLTGNDSP